MTKDNEEFDKFDRVMRNLMKVSHGDIKAKLEAEKEAKKQKPRKVSASGQVLRATLICQLYYCPCKA
jgi:hypothetical protein